MIVDFLYNSRHVRDSVRFQIKFVVSFVSLKYFTPMGMKKCKCASVFFPLVMGIYCGLFLMSRVHSRINQEIFERAALGKMSFLTLNGLGITVGFFGLMFLVNLVGLSSANVFYRYVVGGLFSIALCVESVITLMFWGILIQGEKNFLTPDHIAIKTRWHFFCDLSVHVVPFVGLMITFISENLYLPGCVIGILLLIFGACYICILCYCHVVAKTVVYMFAKDFMIHQFLMVGGVGVIIMEIFHLIYSAITRRRNGATESKSAEKSTFQGQKKLNQKKYK